MKGGTMTHIGYVKREMVSDLLVIYDNRNVLFWKVEGIVSWL
jgi:hypothetical protein